MGVAEHYHPHLRVIIDGGRARTAQPRRRSRSSAMSAVHTHEAGLVSDAPTLTHHTSDPCGGHAVAPSEHDESASFPVPGIFQII